MCYAVDLGGAAGWAKRLLCLDLEGSRCQCVAENQVHSTNVDFGVQLWLEYSNYSLETLAISISADKLPSYF